MFHWFKSQANAIFMRFFEKWKKYIKLYYISNRSRAPKNESVRRVGDTSTTTIAINVAFLLSFFFQLLLYFPFFSSLPVALESESCLFGKKTCECASCVCASVCHVCVCVFIRQPVKDLFISFINFVAGLNAIVFIVVVGFFNWINWQFGEGAFLAVCLPPVSPLLSFPPSLSGLLHFQTFYIYFLIVAGASRSSTNLLEQLLLLLQLLLLQQLQLLLLLLLLLQ